MLFNDYLLKLQEIFLRQHLFIEFKGALALIIENLKVGGNKKWYIKDMSILKQKQLRVQKQKF